MQTLLVIITFSLAAGFLVKKFIWNPIFEGKQKTMGTLDGGRTKCGKKDCGCM
jgi:flagellar biogenesis protein FliO